MACRGPTRALPFDAHASTLANFSTRTNTWPPRFERIDMQFTKYHGLGNDYIVMDPAQIGRELARAEVRLICHRNYGPGSDGILWGPSKTASGDFSLRIFNPDGSEAEKSGNGLRIFARFLFDCGLVRFEPFAVHTLGGTVRCCVKPGGDLIQVEMGQVSFDAASIPVSGYAGDVLNQTLSIDGKDYRFCAATIGNPHCVLHLDDVSEELARRLGPQIENDPRFPNRTNVQFMKVLGRCDIQIEIWERGAGYTLASGSSSSAAAAVAYRLGLCDRDITVHMPGGELKIELTEDYNVTMTGPVICVCTGTIAAEAFTVPACAV
jgi:diaminopimelate epimerase